MTVPSAGAKLSKLDVQKESEMESRLGSTDEDIAEIKETVAKKHGVLAEEPVGDTEQVGDAEQQADDAEQQVGDAEQQIQERSKADEVDPVDILLESLSKDVSAETIPQKIRKLLKVEKLPSNLTDFKSAVKTANTQDDAIAFTLGQNKHFHDANGSTIVFNKVIDVLGPSSEFLASGVFTCPGEGVYKFQVYSLTFSGQRIWLELYRNQELVVSLYGYTPNNYAATANAVILFLKEGDQIFVKTRYQYDVMLFGTPDQIYTTFSGVLLPNSRVAASNGYNDDDISFSATLSAHKVFLQGSTILYDKVLLNQGFGYNNYSGMFMAPVHGIYIFHFFSLAEKDSEIWQELYHNSDYVCALRGHTPSEFAAAGNTAIVHMRSGDTVQIKARQINKLYGVQDQLYSTFSGALIIRESRKVPLSSRMIAFSVALSTSTVVSANSKVMFDQIFINLKHAYDQHTGDFTAPTDGLYEFNVHALGQSGEPIWLELFHNYKYIVSLYSHVPDRYGSTGNSAVIRLYSGDVVYVKTRHDRNSALYGGPKNIYCTFSGYLVSSTPSGISIVG